MPITRVSSLIILAMVLAVGLSVRLFSISVGQHGAYVALANNQQTVEHDVLPKRGDIFVQDAATGNKVLVATSAERFSVSATPRNVVKKEAYAKVLAKYSGVNEADVLASLSQDTLYMSPLKHGLSKDEVEHIATALNEVERSSDPKHPEIKINFSTDQGNTIYFIGGVIFQREYQRVYPEGGLLSQVLGFVDNSGKGRYGFEAQYDQELKGTSGTLLLEQDSLGTLLKQQTAVSGSDGTNYELSIDRTVQYEAEKELAAQLKDSEAEGGSVIVMNPKTGEIIALANQPTYNISSFQNVSADQISLFDNAAISHVWEPGSIFKPLIMAAAMDLGLVTADTKSTFPESVTVQGYKIETALRKAYGEETMTQVLANSDNVAMVWVANKIGNDNMYNYLERYGFGDFTGIDLKNEISGSVLPASKWRDINRATISFGQGIAVTPLQIISAYAAIANDGKRIQPRVVHALIDPSGNRQVLQPVEGQQIVKPEIAKQLRDMMVATVLTAHNRAGTPGYKIGGKTGTAQIPDPQKGGYIEDAYNHSFIGIGPSDDPKYVMLVKIDHPNLKKVGLFAESTAVPLFGRLSTFLLNYYQIPPTNR
jgi:stage V sporulation protein D (sporulation-specific penicillin-binding protein)